MHVLSSNTEVSLKSNSWGPHFPCSRKFVKHFLMAATTTKSAFPNLATFLISAPKSWTAFWKAQSEWSADTSNSMIQCIPKWTVSSPNSYHHSPKDQGQSLLLSFALQIQIPNEFCWSSLYPIIFLLSLLQAPMLLLIILIPITFMIHYQQTLWACLQAPPPPPRPTSQLFSLIHLKCCCCKVNLFEGHPCLYHFCS